MSFLPRPSRRNNELTVEPIPLNRMTLLWMTPEELNVIELAVAEDHAIIVGPEKGGPRGLTVTRSDIEWARGVDRIAAKAVDASTRGDFVQAIDLYLQALVQAPGADIYLMSIGACYVNMGRFRDALTYFRRAHEVSPQNGCVTENLRMLEMVIRSRHGV